MLKKLLQSTVACFVLALYGCGGSASVAGGSAAPVGGTSLEQFQATMPDGSVMELSIFSNDNINYSGDYAVSAETGPYAYQDGTFDGSIVGNSVTLNCQNNDGTSFTMTGTANGDLGFKLMRSDIPGTTLSFAEVPTPKVKAHTDSSFNLNVTGTSGRCVMSDQIFSRQGGMTEYHGTWQGLVVYFWAYDSGYANIVIYINDYAIDSLTYASYRFSDFGTVSKNSNSGYMNAYSPKTKVILKFGAVGAVSPG